MSTYDTFHNANNKGADQTAWMRRLVCTCVVRQPEDRFSRVKAHIVAHIFIPPNSTEEFKEMYSFVKLSLQKDYKKMTFKL